MKFPMTTRVALRHQLKEVVNPDRDRHYMRVEVFVDLPSRDPYIKALQSVAANVAGVIPLVKQTAPLRITVDLPTDARSRTEVMKALKRLPFVQAVLGKQGGPIRRR